MKNTTKKDTTKTKVIKNLIEQAERELIQNKILSDFYAEYAKEQDEETAAKTLLKKSQIDSTITFNTKFYDYLKSL
jgi:hypothetical protein